MAVVSAREFEAVQSELSVFQQRLRSKEEALQILKRELDSAHSQEGRLRQEIAQLPGGPATPGDSTADQREELKGLFSKRWWREAQRSQLARSPASPASPKQDTVREREQFIAQLEEAGQKITALERQLRNTEDEKEDVMSERDYYSGQVTSLRQCLDQKESVSLPTQSAFQGIMEENRRLKLELVEAQAGRDHALSKAERYKRAVEHWKTKDTQTQFLSSDKNQDVRQSLRRVSELEALANSLSESVKEKSIALTHQKKANKMLATRIAELEHRLRALEISGLWSSNEAVMPELSWAEDSRGSVGSTKPEWAGPQGEGSGRKLSKDCGPRTGEGRGDEAGSATTGDTDPQTPSNIVELT